LNRRDKIQVVARMLAVVILLVMVDNKNLLYMADMLFPRKNKRLYRLNRKDKIIGLIRWMVEQVKI